MDELIDILDAEGNETGKTAMKSEAHKNGWFHQTVHIWFYTLDSKILLQQRGKDKDIYPLLWDVSVAGHIGSGENISIAAIREVTEEIGLTISRSELHKISVFKSIKEHRVDLIDCEFHHAFISELKLPFVSLQKQESEVEQLRLISIHQFNNELNNASRFSYVPHDMFYYTTIVRRIQEQIANSQN